MDPRHVDRPAPIDPITPSRVSPQLYIYICIRFIPFSWGRCAVLYIHCMDIYINYIYTAGPSMWFTLQPSAKADFITIVRLYPQLDSFLHETPSLSLQMEHIEFNPPLSLSLCNLFLLHSPIGCAFKLAKILRSRINDRPLDKDGDECRLVADWNGQRRRICSSRRDRLGSQSKYTKSWRIQFFIPPKSRRWWGEFPWQIFYVDQLMTWVN